MKKSLIIALILAMSLGICACGDKDGSSGSIFDINSLISDTLDGSEEENTESEEKIHDVQEGTPTEVPLELYYDAFEDFQDREAEYMNDEDTHLWDLEFIGGYYTPDEGRFIFLTEYSTTTDGENFNNYTYEVVYDIRPDNAEYQLNEELTNKKSPETSDKIIKSYPNAQKVS